MDEVRDSVAPDQLAGREVFHYSIPALVEYGDGVLEDGDTIASSKPLLRGGELLVSKLNPRKSHVLIARAPSDPTVCSGEFIVLRPRACNARFMFYVFSSEVVRQGLDGRVQSVTKSHQRVGSDDIAKLWISVPSLEVQRNIADFLDRETARIDGLMGVKKRLLTLLEERRQNEVIKAVTHGLANDRLVPADSPWFPRLPATWSLEPLKRRWIVIDCKHRTPVYVEHGYPLVSHAEIEDGRVYPGRSGRFVEEADYLDLIEGRRPKRGDIIYTRNAAIGNAGYVDTDEDFAMGQDVCLITSDHQDQRFLTYFLNCVAVEQLAAQRLGATFGRINVAQIVNLQILCPPLEEQRAIADYLDARRNSYETLAAQLHRQVELLAEHEQALITVSVTGQVDVRGESA